MIVSEETAADGKKSRFGCIVPINDARPVFLNMHPLWSADETSVDLVYADAEGRSEEHTSELQSLS